MFARPLKFVLQLSVVAGVSAQPQPNCPAVSFQTAVSASLEPSAHSHVILLRESDGSYTGYEIASSSPYQIIRRTPNFQKQLTACLPSHASLPPLPPPAGSGILPGGPSQPQAFARLNSGDYLLVNANVPYNDAVVALFDSELNLISQNQLPLNTTLPTLVDLNGDGNLDVVGVVLNENPLALQVTTTIEILLGSGGASFHAAASYQLSGNYAAVSVAVADLNGDHKPDLVIASSFPYSGAPGGKISVLLGNGDGTFQAERVIYSTEAYTPHAVAVADLNGDGRADLAFTEADVSGSLYYLAVALGNGDGTFAAGTTYPAQADNTLVIADLNGDGIPDIVTSGVSIFYGDGTGAFPHRLDYLVPGDGLVLTDFDGDGRMDIVVGEGNPIVLGGGLISVLFGWGNGSYFGPPVSPVPGYPTSGNPLFGALSSADFNGDGNSDLAFADDLGRITILLGAGDGSYKSTFQYDFSKSSGIAGAIATADFNNDGKPDIAVTVQGPNLASAVEIFLGRGDGTFAAPAILTAPATLNSLVAGDFNGDGKVDLAVVQTSQNLGVADNVLILLGNGDGTFASPVSYPAGPAANAISAGDFNGDGKLDLVVTNMGSLTDASKTGNVTLLFGKGDGTFSGTKTIPLSQGQGVGPTGVVADDFNQDGKLDLAVTFSSQGKDLVVLLGRGDGTFLAPVAYPASSDYVLTGDINGDGIPDLIAGTANGGAGYLLGNGDGTFQPQVPIFTTYGVPELIGPVAIADINRDGRVDVAATVDFGLASFLNTSPQQLALVSAATLTVGPAAPESLAIAFGQNLATDTGTAPVAQPLPTTLGQTTVRVQDALGTARPAPLLSVSPQQVNFLVPSGTSTGAATVTVTTERLFGNLVHSTQIQIVPVAPSLFTLNSAGLAAAYLTRVRPGQPQTNESVFTLQNGSPVAKPIDLGPPGDQVYLVLFGTGIRNAGTGGVTVDIQGLSAPVSYAGPQGEFDGLDQINVLLPTALAGDGDVKVVLTAAGVVANTVHISIQ